MDVQDSSTDLGEFGIGFSFPIPVYLFKIQTGRSQGERADCLCLGASPRLGIRKVLLCYRLNGLPSSGPIILRQEPSLPLQCECSPGHHHFMPGLVVLVSGQYVLKIPHNTPNRPENPIYFPKWKS